MLVSVGLVSATEVGEFIPRCSSHLDGRSEDGRCWGMEWSEELPELGATCELPGTEMRDGSLELRMENVFRWRWR